MTHVLRKVALMLAAVMTACAGMDQAVAASATWTGGSGNGTWSNSSNWSTLPTTSGSWSLVFGGTTQTTNTNNIGTITLGTMSFTNDGSIGKTATFTLSGSTLALNNGTIITSATTSGSAITNSVGNALTLSGSNAANFGSGHSVTFSGNISGAGSLTKSGVGALYLTGSNSQSGATYITDGNVRTGSSGSSSDSNNFAFGTSNVVVSGSATLAVRNSSTVSNNITIGGVGTSTTNGSLLGSFGASDQTAVVSGTVALSSDATISSWGSTGVTGSKLSLNGPINLGSNRLTFNQTVTNAAVRTSIDVGGAISGSGSVIVTGTATVALNSANSYSGGTTIQSGTVSVGNGSALGTGSVAVNGGLLDLNGRALSIGTLSGSAGGVIASRVGGSASILTNSAVQSTFGGSITNGSGVVGLTKSGSGGLNLTGSSSYSGTTYLTGGSVRTGSGGASSDSNNFAFGTSNVVVSGSATLAVRNSSTVSNNITIGGVGTSTTNGALLGSFGASGQTAVVSGSVALSSDATISSWGSTGVTGSKLSLSGPINLGSNRLTFNQTVLGASLRSLTDPATWVTVGGVISGSGSVDVDGGASVYLNGANTYAGATTVKSGVLGGNGTIACAVTVQNGAFLTPGSAANTTGALGVGSLQLDSGATAAMSISGTGASLYDQVVALGNVNYGGTLAIDFTTAGFANFDVWQLFSGNSFSGNFSSITATGSYGTLTFNDLGTGEWKATGGLLAADQSLSFYVDNSHAIGGRYQAGQLVLVPEPSTIVFAGIGLLVVGWQRLAKRRRGTQSAVDAIAAA